jgi:hypothetical protein
VTTTPEHSTREEHGPILAVGPSRSGTSVVREILNRHTGVWIVRETHYFDDLRTRFAGRERGPLSDDERRSCEDYFLKIGHRAYGAESDPEQSLVARADLAALAEELGGGPDAHFEAFCRLDAVSHGRTDVRWGEKTPRHVFRIAEMLAAFPSARIVCLIRDPRAVVASYRDWTRRKELSPDLDTPWTADRRRARRSYHVVLGSLMWRAATNAAIAAQRSFGSDRVYHLRYEGLLTEPEACVRGLCSWLDLEYQPSMLDVPLVQSSYRAGGDSRGISTEPLERWRERLSPVEIAAVQSTCGTVMRGLGYEPEPRAGGPFRVAAAYLTLPTAVARAGLANRSRMGRAGSYFMRRLRFGLGRT